MNIDDTVRTIEFWTSPAFLAMCIEEKATQFGFLPDDQILKTTLEGLPETIPVKIKFKKEKEGTVLVHNGPET